MCKLVFFVAPSKSEFVVTKKYSYSLGAEPVFPCLVISLNFNRGEECKALCQSVIAALLVHCI